MHLTDVTSSVEMSMPGMGCAAQRGVIAHHNNYHVMD
jgi:hypothetical protein